MLSKRLTLLPRVAVLLGLASLLGTASAAQIETEAARQALTARVLAVRSQLNAGAAPQDTEGDPIPMVAQWWNWPNWNNWGNWPNWGNWSNWVNWFNR